MIANTITFARLLLTFVVIMLFGRHRSLDIAIIAIIALIFTLDAVDGVIARKRNETSKFGEILDTLADRIIENTFWIYFTVRGLIPLWMPITVMARGVLTDNIRKSLGAPKSGWTHVLTRSRTSRALYGGIKMFTFINLASATVFKNTVMEQGSFILATIAVGFCLLRGLPFLLTVRKRMLADTIKGTV